MIRLVFWCLMGVLLYAGLRKLTGGGRGGAGADRRPDAGAEHVESMVRCRVCGLNLPKSEALPVGDQWACCAQHARASGPGKPT
jgi:hypothetical protein